MTSRAIANRAAIQRFLRKVPFQRFVISMENGDQITIGHPENIAFDPSTNGSDGSVDFYVISGKTRYDSTFEAVTGVAVVERRKVK